MVDTGSFERINIGLYFKQDSFPEALFSPPLRDGATMFFDRSKQKYDLLLNLISINVNHAPIYNERR